MEKEKIAVIGLALIIIIGLSAYIVTTEDVFENLFGEKKVVSNKIEQGDCVDVHFVGRYYNDGLFGYSYEDLTDMSGGNPLNIFVSYNSSASPPTNYSGYSNKIQLSYAEYYVEEFISSLIGMKEGEKKTIGPFMANGSFGIRPQEGDVINLTEELGATFVYEVIETDKDVNIGEEYQDIFGNITTNMYTLKDVSHYINESMESYYSFWVNSTMVTGMNETHIYLYTTPTTSINETFNWTEVVIDEESGSQLYYEYPVDSSYVSSINSSTIVVTHSPSINSTINVSMVSSYGLYPYQTYTVENVTADKINTSYNDSITGNLSYKDFNRTSIIQRNESQQLVQEPIPGELLEGYLFSIIRGPDSDFQLGYNPFTETIVIDIEIVDVYKTS